MTRQSVLNRITQVGKQVIPANGSLWLFGSRAREDNRPDSDWDLLAIIDKDKLLPSDYDTITYPLTELGWEIGEQINPILYTRKEWESGWFTPFHHNVVDDKIELI